MYEPKVLSHLRIYTVTNWQGGYVFLSGRNRAGQLSTDGCWVGDESPLWCDIRGPDWTETRHGIDQMLCKLMILEKGNLMQLNRAKARQSINWYKLSWASQFCRAVAVIQRTSEEQLWIVVYFNSYTCDCNSLKLNFSARQMTREWVTKGPMVLKIRNELSWEVWIEGNCSPPLM